MGNWVSDHFLLDAEFRVDEGIQALGTIKAFGLKVGLSGEKETIPILQFNGGYYDSWYSSETSPGTRSYGYGVSSPVRTSWSAGYYVGANQNYSPHRKLLKLGSLESETINLGIFNITNLYDYKGNVLEHQFTLDFGFDFSLYLGASGYLRTGFKFKRLK